MFSWPSVYTIASNVARDGDHPVGQVLVAICTYSYM